MASIILPLHGKGDVSVHRQLMVDATGGKGFHPAFMERTMIQLGFATPAMFKPDVSKRQLRKAAAKALYLARCRAQAAVNIGDRAGITHRIQSNMIRRMEERAAYLA